MSRFVPPSPSVPSINPPTYRYGFSKPTTHYHYKSPKGLSSTVVKNLSYQKSEPTWMLQSRLQALKLFQSLPLPSWGPDLTQLNWQDLHYYLRPASKSWHNWADVPVDIKDTFERLGTPKAEREFLAGVKNQYDSEVVYGSLKKIWEDQGVIFLSLDEALIHHPDLVKTYFGTVVAPGDNKLAALNAAVWSGGSFIYIPKNVQLTLPLQAYFRLNAENAGQFERSLIIADEGSFLHYVEGCSSPSFSSASLHAAVVEIIVKPGACVQYTTIQNWFPHVYNLVTKRTHVATEGRMVWTDFNLGSKTTMKYPSFILAGPGAKGETLSLAFAGSGQHQDTGSKAIHLAPHTTSTIISKSISKAGGRTSYRGLVTVAPQAYDCKSRVVCDALLLDDQSQSDTYPTNHLLNQNVVLEHEASVSQISQDQLYYLMSRGLTETQASQMIIQGFVAPLIKKLPLEYAVEMNRLIDLEMQGSVG